MSLSIQCVYCGKPLIDADNARNHVVNQCESSPSKRLADALESIRSELADLLTGKCEGGHPDIDDQTRGDLSALEGKARAALWAAGRL